MKYYPRPGIIKTKICDQYVLLPMREASDACGEILMLPRLWAATWDAIATDYPLEKSVQIHALLLKKSEEEARAEIERFCAALAKKGFLISEDAEQNDE